jgi:hypothetical protein
MLFLMAIGFTLAAVLAPMLGGRSAFLSSSSWRSLGRREPRS